MSAVAEQDQTVDVGDDTLAVEGTDQQLSFNVGGKAPLSSSLRVTGRAIEVEGQFAKGETVTLMVECVVDEITFRDVKDRATGQVVDCQRKQKASIVHVAIVENAVQPDPEPGLFDDLEPDDFEQADLPGLPEE